MSQVWRACQEEVLLSAPASDVAAGSQFSCAALQDGTVWCWGANQGRLGNDTEENSAVPVPVLLPTD
ncbi:MAG: hypothetical protein OXU20_16680 [Myxococcales bacterium]|nr:hypothetical protein [Myxococcales bacterium]MDD9965576.1 hypothetical protein [Myxococcales bacterium]